MAIYIKPPPPPPQHPYSAPREGMFDGGTPQTPKAGKAPIRQCLATLIAIVMIINVIMLPSMVIAWLANS